MPIHISAVDHSIKFSLPEQCNYSWIWTMWLFMTYVIELSITVLWSEIIVWLMLHQVHYSDNRISSHLLGWCISIVIIIITTNKHEQSATKFKIKICSCCHSKNLSWFSETDFSNEQLIVMIKWRLSVLKITDTGPNLLRNYLKITRGPFSHHSVLRIIVQTNTN